MMNYSRVPGKRFSKLDFKMLPEKILKDAELFKFSYRAFFKRLVSFCQKASIFFMKGPIPPKQTNLNRQNSP